MADLVWDLITLGKRIYDMIHARQQPEDIKADARDQLDVAIDNAIAKAELRRRG